MKKWILKTAVVVCALSCSALALASEMLLKPLDAKVATQLYQPQSNAVGGNPQGKVTLVEVFDYNCGFCRSLTPTIGKLIQKNPDLRVVYKEFSLNGENSEPAISAALAAQKQGKYLPLHEALMTAGQPLETTKQVLAVAQKTGLNIEQLEKDMNTPAVKKQIDQNNQLIATLNFDGAPVFIVANSAVMHNAETGKTRQYVFLGSDDAEKYLQHLIDLARKNNQG